MEYHINLLPWREWQQRQRRYRFLSLIVISIIMSLICLRGVGHYFESQQQIQQQRLQLLQTHIQQQQQDLAQATALKTESDNVNQRLQIFTELQQKRGELTRFMSLLPTLLPEQMRLDSMTLMGAKAELYGRSEHTSVLNKLLQRMESQPELHNIDMRLMASPSSHSSNNQQQSFRLQFEFKNKAGEVIE